MVAYGAYGAHGATGQPVCNISCKCATPGICTQHQLQVGSTTLGHTCIWQIGVQVLAAMNYFNNYNFYNDILCLLYVFAKQIFFNMSRRALKAGIVIIIFL